VRFAKWVNNVGAVSTYTAFLLVLASGLVSVRASGPATGAQWAVPLTVDTAFTWSQIVFILTGLELGTIIAGEVRAPQRTAVLATAISAIAVIVFYVAGTSALLVTLPVADIDPVYGAVQAATRAGGLARAPWLPMVLAVVITLGAIGAFGGNLCSVSRLPWVFGVEHYLPTWLGRVHPRLGTPHVAMLTGAGISTCLLIGMFSGESLRSGYNTLYDSTILLSVLPLVVMFAAAWSLGHRLPSALGFVTTVTATAFTLVPPPDTTAAVFEAKILGVLAVSVLSGCWLYHRAQRPRVSEDAAVAEDMDWSRPAVVQSESRQSGCTHGQRHGGAEGTAL
jgi:amino acid transporter